MDYIIKRFSSTRRVILPGNKRECDPLPKKFTDNPKYDNLMRIVIIENTGRYNKNIQTLPKIARDRVKNLRTSIKNGHLYENGDFQDEETHYISKFSKPNLYHRFTKDIDDHNRLDYIVYPPKVVKDEETGDTYLVTKVVLQNCVGHFDWEKEKLYSETDKPNEGND